jgi:hypothetical protein
VRDAVQAKDSKTDFIFDCATKQDPSSVVVGTWPRTFTQVSGPAIEVWRIDLHPLKFASLHQQAFCLNKSYAGADDGRDLVDGARDRVKAQNSKQQRK